MSEDAPPHALNIFLEAFDLEGEEREALLKKKCAGDGALRARVDALFAQDAKAAGRFGETQLQAHRAELESIARGGSVALPALSVRNPKAIGEYRILGRLGRGGTGLVYEAEQDNPRRRVAVKVLQPAAMSDTLLARFQLEAQILGSLVHPNIAQIHAAGTFDQGSGPQPFFAMELVEGEDLLTWSRVPGRKRTERLEVFILICEAVHHAHMKGVVHRDLKPDNVLVTSGGQPKILDFGVARAVDADVQLTTMHTEVGQLVGTIAYMSPEQAAGDARKVDARSDIYTLGTLLFQILGDRLPHDIGQRSIPEAVRIIREDEPTSLSSMDTTLRGDLDTIVRRALEKDPARRYVSAIELGADVERHLNHEPIHARPPSTFYQLQKLVRRHRGIAAGAVLAAAALLIGLIVSIRFGLEAQRRSEESQRTAYRMSMTGAQAALRDGDSALATEILAATPSELRAWEWYYLQAQIDLHIWEVPVFSPPGAQNSARVVRFTPDGAFVIAQTEADALGIWTSAEGTLVRTIRFAAELVPGLLSVSATTIAAAAADDRLRLLNLETGEEQFSFPIDGQLTAIAWEPSGEQLALATLKKSDDLGNRHELRVCVPQDGILTVAQGAESIGDLAWVSGGEQLFALIANRFEQDQGFVLATDTWSETGRLSKGTGRSASTPMALAGAARGDLVIAGSNVRAVWFWDARDDSVLQPHGILDGHIKDFVRDVALSDDGARGASVTSSGTLRVWDMAQQRSIASYSTAWTDSSPVGCDIGADGRRVAVVGAGRLRVWDVEALEARVLSGHETFVYFLDISPDGRTILSRDFEGELRLWDSADGRPLATWSDTALIETMLFLGDHEFVFSSDGAQVIGKLGSRAQLGFSVANVAADSHLRRVPRTAEPTEDREEFKIRTQPERLELVGRRPSTPHHPVSPDGTTGLYVWSRVVTDADGRVLRELEGPDKSGLLTSSSQSGSFAPDGRRVAVADMNAEIYDVSTGALVGKLVGHTGTVYGIAWSPDGQRIATGSNDRTIRIWDADTRKTLLVLRGHKQHVYGLAWSPDGTQLVSCSGDGTVRIWDALRASERTFTSAVNQRLREEVRAGIVRRSDELQNFQMLADELRADSKLSEPHRHASLAVVRELVNARQASRRGQLEQALRSGVPPAPVGRGEPGLAERFSARILRPTKSFTEFEHKPSSPAPDSSGDRVWLGTADGRTLALDSHSGAQLNSFKRLDPNEADPPIRAAWLAPDGRRLAVAGWGLTIWDTQTHEILAHRSKGLAIDVAWHPRDGSVWFLEAEGPEEWQTPENSLMRWDGREFEQRLGLSNSRALGFSPDGSVLGRIESRMEQGQRVVVLALYDATSLQPRRIMTRCTSFAYTPDGSIAVGRLDGRIEILDGESLVRLSSVGHHETYALVLECSPDGAWLASVSTDGTLKLWDLANGREPLNFPIDADFCKESNLTFCGNNRQLTWRSPDTQYVLELDRVHGLRLERQATDPPELAWLDSDRLALRNESGVRVWSAASGSELQVSTEAFPVGTPQPKLAELNSLLEGHLDNVTCLTHDPSSGQLVGGDDAGNLRFWNAETGELLLKYPAHNAPLRKITIAPTSTWIATLDATGQVTIWDTRK